MKSRLNIEFLEQRDCPAAGSTLIPVGVGVDYTLSINTSGRIASMQLAAPDWVAWSNGSQTQAQAEAMAQRIYQFFPDQFDHIIFVNNQTTIPPAASYFGVTYPVKNDTLGIGDPSGIGTPIFNNGSQWGSGGKLQTVIHLIDEETIRQRTSLHELTHRWSAFLPELQSSAPGHWGFSSVGGQLGGWAPGTLRSIGPGLYDADGPKGTTDWQPQSAGTAANTIGYAQLELYNLGLITAAEVDPIQYAVNGAFTNFALGQFSADSIQTVTINNIISQEGLRLPTPATSQKDFRAITVILTPNPLTQAELDTYDTDVELFGRPGSDGDPTLKNFWEATGGRATLKLDGLDRFLPTGNPVLGVGTNGSALGLAIGSTGTYDTVLAQNIQAYFGVSGDSVRIAVGDVDGDKIPDFAVSTGPGVDTRFGVFSGDQTRWIIAPTAPFRGSEDFSGGAFVSLGDLDGDGRADVVVSADNGGGPRVVIYSYKPSTGVYPLADFFGIADASFRGGARTAVGDVNHDGRADLAVAAGPGGGPRVVVYNGMTLLSSRTKLVNDFFVYPGADAVNLRNGVYLAIGDVNADGFGDLIAGAGDGGGPRVLALSGQTLTSRGPLAAFSSPLADFFSGNTADRGGVRVTVKNVDNDGRADIVTGSGAGLAGDVRVYLGSSLRGRAKPPLFQDLPVFGTTPLLDGVFVG